jgi:hypothetical protein
MSKSVQGYSLLVKPKGEPRVNLFIYADSASEAVAKAKEQFPDAAVLITESSKAKSANRVYSSKQMVDRWRRDHRL